MKHSPPSNTKALNSSVFTLTAQCFGRGTNLHQELNLAKMTINFVNDNTAYRRMRIPSEGGWNNPAKSCFSWIGLITLPAKALVTLECQSADAVRISFSYRRLSKKSIYLRIKHCNNAVTTYYNGSRFSSSRAAHSRNRNVNHVSRKFSRIGAKLIYLIFNILYRQDYMSLYKKFPAFIYTFKAQMLAYYATTLASTF